MKILIVTGYFPPLAPASASRVNKFSKYLEDRGHDVRVLAPKYETFDRTLVPEISEEKIYFVEFLNVNKIPKKVKKALKSFWLKKSDVSSLLSTNAKPSQEAVPSKESFLSKLYRRLTNIPDSLIGWYPSAVREGRDMFQNWSPDVIFCTVPPFTPLLVASRLARIIDVPWVADYRDLWSDHAYYSETGLRRRVDRFLERRALKNCSGLITVTKTWAEHLRNCRDIPVEFAMNGFESSDFTDLEDGDYDPEKITLIYAGLLYGRKRDPSVLFEALGRMGDKAKNYKVLFFTPMGKADIDEAQRAMINKYALEDIIEFKGYIPQKELLKLQKSVDLLMLLRWDDPREDGVIAGKLFEYIGCGKPILSLGSTTGEAADIIRENNFGFISNNPDEIAHYLQEAYDQKMAGNNRKIKNPNRDKFKRSIQFDKIEAFMEKLVQEKS